MGNYIRRSRGSVLWVALIAIILAMSVALSLLQTSVSNSKSQDKFGAQTNAFFATHGAVELVVSDYYGRYSAQAPSTQNINGVMTLINPNGIGNFDVWLQADLASASQAFSTLSTSTGDKVGEDFRAGPKSYTPATSASASPTADASTIVTRAIVTKFNGNLDGDRMVTTVRLYRKLRPQPGNYIVDLLVVVETQKNVGATATAQTSAATNMTIGDKIDMLQPQWESQLFTFQSPPTFNGLDFALLTKNVSCTMCHLQTRNRARVDNLNNFTAFTAAGNAAAAAALKAQWGTFERTKIGITENLTLRANSMFSQVEGTLYQRGTLQYEGSGTKLSPSNFVGDTAWSTGFNSGKTTMSQDPTTGFVTKTPFVNNLTDQTTSPVTIPAPNGSLYLNYGSTTTMMTDGGLPASNFPCPFPEGTTVTNVKNTAGTTVQTITGPNNFIDSTEIQAAAQDLHAASDISQHSSISGGIALKLSAGTVYDSPTLPTANGQSVPTKTAATIDYLGGTATGTAGTATTAAANIISGAAGTPSYTGNTILIGTAANPLVIDGKVLIDGDVVLRGYVKGTGQLFATGNVYIPGDVIYANAGVGTTAETFGKASDGTTNLLSVVAGKNIVVGDFISQITGWDSNNSNQFTPYKLTTVTNSSGTATNTLTPMNGSFETGKKQTYVAPANVSNTTTNTFVNGQSLGTIGSIAMPTGTKYANGTTVGSTTFGNSNEPNFIMQQLTIYNRNELMKTMPILPTQDPTQASSYTTNGGGVPNVPNTSTPANSPPDATLYDANYIPKFYSFYPYDSANPQTNPALALIYNGSTYSTSNKSWNGVTDPHGFDYFKSVDSMPAGSISVAAQFAKNVINVAPNWIAPATMLRIVSSEQEIRVPVMADVENGAGPSYQVPDRRLDGVMYTKNAVLCIERSKAQHYDPVTGTWSRVNTVSGGRVQVNGALIAPDTGLLICDGPEHDSWPGRQNFIINYDSRVKNLLAIANQDFSSFNNWGVVRVTMVRNTGFAPLAP